MQVIAKRSILFVNEHDFRADKKPPRKHTVIASKDVQDAPDWLRDQSAFQTAAADGTITEVEIKTVTKVVPKSTLVELPQVTEHHVKFLQFRGYVVGSIAEAAKFVTNLTEKQQVKFFADAGEWTEPETTEVFGPDALNKMTKVALQAHALETHGLELDERLNKPEMVAAILEAQKPKP